MRIVGCMAAILLSALLVFCLADYRGKVGEDQDSEQTNSNIGTDYADLLFDDSYVHVINIEISDDNYNYMLDHALDEKYVSCDVVIDGERVDNVGLRPKGNSSLHTVQSLGQTNYSFKIEFDHYDSDTSYEGLDKLVLNNLGMDKTMMKDYLTYHMMEYMGVPGPLSSYALLQLNGRDFGLYLAVEAVEDSFAYRNYGSEPGQLYRPDVFDMSTMSFSNYMGQDMVDTLNNLQATVPGERTDYLGDIINVGFQDRQEENLASAVNYVGDDEAAYQPIFDTSVFELSQEDRQEYVAAVRQLAQSEDPADALELDWVINYFVVHSYVNNYDSYTSPFVHNFYLHEQDGRLSLVPWDYNLGFGAFSIESAYKDLFYDTSIYIPMDIGCAMPADMSYVNYPIDEPLYSCSLADRPMVSSWMENEDYRQLYHQRMAEFLEGYFDSGYYAREQQRINDMIRPYVKDGLAYYNLQEFDRATEVLNNYCELRTESIKGQLAGDIPTTIAGQLEDQDNLIVTDDLDLWRTIDFNGFAMAFGVSREDFISLALAISGGDNSFEGLEAGMAELQEHPAHIFGVIAAATEGSPFLQRLMFGAVRIILCAIIAVVILVIIIKLIKRKRGGVRL